MKDVVEYLINHLGMTKTEAKKYVRAFQLEQGLPKTKEQAKKFLEE